MKYVNNPAGNYMFKVNNKNTRTRFEICSKLIIKTPERCHWRKCSGKYYYENFSKFNKKIDVPESFFNKITSCQPATPL